MHVKMGISTFKHIIKTVFIILLLIWHYGGSIIIIIILIYYYILLLFLFVYVILCYLFIYLFFFVSVSTAMRLPLDFYFAVIPHLYITLDLYYICFFFQKYLYYILLHAPEFNLFYHIKNH